MSGRDTGGAAFPHQIVNENGIMFFEPGMTRRQWYAGQALAGLCATCPDGAMRDLADGTIGGRFVAAAALALADKLIELESAP